MITQALHTYFTISNIEDVKIEGLEGNFFLDTLTNAKSKENFPITIDAECDRVYQSVIKDIKLHDSKRSITLAAKGSSSTVVWNPWIEKGSKMSAMKSDGYKSFICIETANAFDDARVIAVDSEHTLMIRYSALSLS